MAYLSRRRSPKDFTLKELSQSFNTELDCNIAKIELTRRYSDEQIDELFAHDYFDITDLNIINIAISNFHDNNPQMKL
jgi:hypothetical protein